ncbi:MAG: CvpA family protein [Clostridia bacterium]|nr:CvpA family protein [Clostridia bacterium]
MKKATKLILAAILTLAFGFVWFYFTLPAVNLRAASFWITLVLLGAVFFFAYKIFGGRSAFESFAHNAKEKNGQKKPMGKRAKQILIVAMILAVVIIAASFITSSRVFRASDYQKMLTVNEADFAEDIAELPISQIPIVDRDVAARLSTRKLGEVVELVSQFNVADYYSQINYKEKPFRVTPLEYDGILKWFANKEEGIPYYITIDMATQETTLVKLPEGMKYSPSEYFSRNLERHIRFRYPTKMFENLSFEIDDEGKPYWVMSYYDYTFGLFGGKDIKGIILVDAVTGEMTDYTVDRVPQWIDKVYAADMIIEQADNWGTLKNGFLNSVFTQKDVIETTDGYNYIAVDDDMWLYTGLTSVVADESNIGFILVNMRTKEAKTYSINGAEEYSAMSSAEGQVQNLRYTATFPILVNIGDQPTYFLSLKDNAGLVRMYAYVSVSDYQKVAVADTIEGARAKYMTMLGVSDSTIEPPAGEELPELKGLVSAIASAVVDGNTVYYIEVSTGEGSAIYRASIKLDNRLPLLAAGETVTFRANEEGVVTEIIKIGE